MNMHLHPVHPPGYGPVNSNALNDFVEIGLNVANDIHCEVNPMSYLSSNVNNSILILILQNMISSP